MYKPKENKWDVDSNDDYEKVIAFIDKKEEKIEKIKKDLNDVKDLFKDYIEYTKKYCGQIATLALKLKPMANTIEGDLTQAIQGILLFNSISLETLANEMQNIFKASTYQKDNSIQILDDFSKMFQEKLSDLLNNYGAYVNEIENYEKYLMKEEMGIKNNSLENNELNNNIENVLRLRKNYVDKIAPMNEFLNKLSDFGLKQEKLLNEEFFNISKIFVDKLNECLEGQKKKYQDQSAVLAELFNKIQSSKLENLKARVQDYSLHCLSIYINYKDAIRMKLNNGSDNQKGKNFDLYKDITLENIENIIQKMKNNGLEIKNKDLEDLEIEKVKDFIESKTKFLLSKTDEKFSLEDKNKIIEYIKNKEEYRLFFLQLLNNDRAKGGRIQNLNIFNYIGEIFKCINDIMLDNNDYKSFKYVSIISMTYYYSEEKNGKKVYIYEFIKDNKRLKDINFWKCYVKHIVDLEIKNNPTKEELKNEKTEQNKLKFAAFSNVLTIANNMINFNLDENFVNEFISVVQKEYSLSKEEISQIKDLMVVWSNDKK